MTPSLSPVRRRTPRPRSFRTVVCAGLVGLALTTGGCGQVQGEGGTSATAHHTFNHQDVTFTEGMIPRQRQARYMGTLAEGRTNNPMVLMMASRIRGWQDGWTEAMSTCLTAWGHSTPRGMMGSTHSGTMMGGDPDGMMTGADLSELAATSGPEFDQMFLRMMVRHHQGTLALAHEEAMRGLDPAAVKLARRVRVVQLRELMRMQQMQQVRDPRARP
jgi:uncharacterized protein (DUF305 family)